MFSLSPLLYYTLFVYVCPCIFNLYVFLTKCVKSQSIPFEISEPKLSKDLKKAIKKAQKIANNSKRKKYNDVQNLIKALLDD